jgi:hypothetical protein
MFLVLRWVPRWALSPTPGGGGTATTPVPSCARSLQRFFTLKSRAFTWPYPQESLRWPIWSYAEKILAFPLKCVESRTLQGTECIKGFLKKHLLSLSSFWLFRFQAILIFVDCESAYTAVNCQYLYVQQIIRKICPLLLCLFRLPRNTSATLPFVILCKLQSRNK